MTTLHLIVNDEPAMDPVQELFVAALALEALRLGIVDSPDKAEGAARLAWAHREAFEGDAA